MTAADFRWAGFRGPQLLRRGHRRNGRDAAGSREKIVAAQTVPLL